MKEKTLNKLQELGKKDIHVKSIVQSFIVAELILPNNISDKDKNNMLISILKKAKSNSIIQEAIRILENDTKEDNQKNNNNFIEINLDFIIEGVGTVLRRKIDINQYKNMQYPEFLIDDIILSLKKELIRHINKEIKGK